MPLLYEIGEVRLKLKFEVSIDRNLHRQWRIELEFTFLLEVRICIRNWIHLITPLEQILRGKVLCHCLL